MSKLWWWLVNLLPQGKSSQMHEKRKRNRNTNPVEQSLEEARHTNDKPAVAALKHTIEVMMFDKDVITALLEGNRPKAADIVRIRAGNQICRIEKIWPLEIRWVDPAEEVFVHEYDGKETLCMKRDLILWNA